MFYESIASVYDFIFPQKRKQLTLIEKISAIQKDEAILDIGCATGNLTALLSEKSDSVIGIDLDRQLLDIAKEKHPAIEFHREDMLLLDDKFQEQTFDRVVSFGNTLVHLSSRDNVKEFFRLVYKLLKNNSRFIVQIINYDRVLSKNISFLPTIENDNIRFVRKYNVHSNHKSLDFNTELTIKETGRVLKNQIALLALRRNEIQDFLVDAGFRDIRFYGDIDGRDVSEDSVALLFSCVR